MVGFGVWVHHMFTTGMPGLAVVLLRRVLLFVIGGVSGFMTALVPLDLQLTDTCFIVAHPHCVLLGITPVGPLC